MRLGQEESFVWGRRGRVWGHRAPCARHWRGAVARLRRAFDVWREV